MLQVKHVGYPVDAVIAVEEVSKQAIQVCMSLSDYELEQQRRLAVLKLKLKARSLQEEE